MAACRHNKEKDILYAHTGELAAECVISTQAIFLPDSRIRHECVRHRLLDFRYTPCHSPLLEGFIKFFVKDTQAHIALVTGRCRTHIVILAIVLHGAVP